MSMDYYTPLGGMAGSLNMSFLCVFFLLFFIENVTERLSVFAVMLHKVNCKHGTRDRNMLTWLQDT